MSRAPSPCLLAANWKMNMDYLQTLDFLRRLSILLPESLRGKGPVEMALFPPFTSLRTAQVFSNSYRLPLSLGAQDVSPHASGSFTGEISASMLRTLGCEYVLVGHSESRRNHHETREELVGKVKNSVACGMRPILCVGEKEKGRGSWEEIISQSEEVFSDLEPFEREKVIISYEPVWAIGSSETASPECIFKAVSALKGETEEKFNLSPTVLYGGSVNEGNIGSLKGLGLGGFLVGRASLDPAEFAAIFQCLNEEEGGKR
ncbi:MAG: triosephosphate isomerase [Aeriscardovia sp.]|nr:triosephosphate isomerase [Aeriscardovia sp.]